MFVILFFNMSYFRNITTKHAYSSYPNIYGTSKSSCRSLKQQMLALYLLYCNYHMYSMIALMWWYGVIILPTSRSILVWDTRAPKTSQTQPDKKKEAMTNPANVPPTFKHLDLTWKPLLKVKWLIDWLFHWLIIWLTDWFAWFIGCTQVGLSKTEPGGDHNPTKFSIYEVQGDRSICKFYYWVF